MGVEFFFQCIGNGGFARARKAGKPDHLAFVAIEPLAILAGDTQCLPVHVLRSAQVVADHADGNGGVSVLVDQDKAAQGV
ncbi:hypothetical protein D3C84_874230 [compost metagenome]